MLSALMNAGSVLVNLNVPPLLAASAASFTPLLDSMPMRGQPMRWMFSEQAAHHRSSSRCNGRSCSARPCPRQPDERRL